MAKAPTTAPVAPTTAPVAPPPPPPAPPAPAGAWDTDLALPAGRVFGASGSKPGTDMFGAGINLEDMPVGASKLIDVVVPASITDQNAADAWFTAEQKKVTNRATSTIRRFREQDAAHGQRQYAIRKVSDDTYGYGVRVFRIADGTASAAKK